MMAPTTPPIVPPIIELRCVFCSDFVLSADGVDVMAADTDELLLIVADVPAEEKLGVNGAVIIDGETVVLDAEDVMEPPALDSGSDECSEKRLALDASKPSPRNGWYAQVGMLVPCGRGTGKL